MDIVNRRADLSRYKLLLTPDLSIMPDETARRLDAYVKNGGVLLADCRTGVKDEHNLCHERTLPGLLSPALGITIEEYTSLGSDSWYKVAASDADRTYTAIQYADWVTPQGAKVVASYPEQWHMKPFAAVTRNEYGKGKAWYVGMVAKEESFYDDLTRLLLEDAGVKPVVHPPLGVEASIRQGQGRRLLFLLNHTDEPKTVTVPQGRPELLSGTKTGDSLTIDRFGVAVLAL